MTRTPLQHKRGWFQVGFFTLFLLAPPLDILRIDLTQGHAILLGHAWTLGIDDFLAGRSGVGDAALNLLLRGFLPIFGGGALFIWIAWRYGRLYCGWLCPHFSAIEVINGLMRRASGRPSIWERRALPWPKPEPEPGQAPTEIRAATGWNPWYWVPTLLAVVGFAFLWALAFLTYLLPPFEIYHNLLTGELTRNQSIFLAAATLGLSVEFLLARHFFCRYACAVGLFQSLAWMANDRAMVVGFDTRRAAACISCDNACDHACPMRLKPRTIKRKMFTCTECGECISACTQVQGGDPQQSLLRWVEGDAALPVVTGRTATGPAPIEPRPVPTPDLTTPGIGQGIEV
jgi:ferredoxin-type protein NapH